MSKYYYKKRKNSWEKVLKDTGKEFSKGFTKMFKRRPININYNNNINCDGPSGGARICVIVLIVVTLLFSGLGFYAWVILGMLFLILQFL